MKIVILQVSNIQPFKLKGPFVVVALLLPKWIWSYSPFAELAFPCKVCGNFLIILVPRLTTNWASLALM